MDVEEQPAPCVPPPPVQPPPEQREPQGLEEAEKKPVVQAGMSSGDLPTRSLQLPRSRSPLVTKSMTSLSREPSAKTARSKSRSRSRSPKVKSLMLSEQAPSPKFVTTRSSSVPAQMDTAKLLTPKKIAIKENPRHVCEAKYSPNVNNVIIFRRHPVSKDFWNNYPVDKHPVLKEHTDSTVIFCC